MGRPAARLASDAAASSRTSGLRTVKALNPSQISYLAILLRQATTRPTLVISPELRASLCCAMLASSILKWEGDPDSEMRD